ncbi:MAG: PAS domain-containing protein [Ferruginibacter sp.]
MIKSLQFLSGGGEMGELIRSFDWSKTAVGSPEAWPQPLRIAVSIMLDSPFGMYIAWGNEYIQMYNDGYRPILGSTKHPQALGISTRKTFAEIWPTIGPMFEGVMQGTPVGFPDFVLQLDRNGFLEECVFDFSYSPIRLENGEVGGVLVTVIETTEKVKSVKALKESLEEVSLAKLAIQKNEENLRSTILQAPVAMCIFKGENFIVDLANDKMFDLWGRTAKEVMHKPIFEALPEAKDQGLEEIVQGVYTTGKTFSADGVPVTLPRNGEIELVYVNLVYEPYREADGTISGILAVAIDVTAQVLAKMQMKESEKRMSEERLVLYNSFMNAPAGIAIYKGVTHIYEFANIEHEKTARRKITIGKTVQSLFPELEQQGLIAMLNNVYSTGEPFVANEFPIELSNEGNDKLVLGYYNLVVQPLKDNNGITERIMSHAVEVTQQVEARKQIEASEKRFGAAVEAVQGILWTNNPKGEMEGEQKSWAALTGQSYEEYQGYGWVAAVHPDDAQPTIEAWIEAVKELKTFVFEHRVKTKSGEWELFSIKAIPLLNKDGSIIEWIGVHTNITERKQNEEKLRYSKALLEAHNEANRDGLLLVDTKGKIISYNQSFIDVWRMPKEIVEAKDDELALKFAMSQLVNPQQFIDKVKWLYEHPSETSIDELEYLDGRIIERHGYSVSGEDGTYYAWSWTFRDITAQKTAATTIIESENQLRIFADSIQSLAWIANADGWIYWYNQQWYDYTATTFEEMQGWGWDKVHHPAHVKKVVEFVKEAWKKDEAWELTFPLRRHDGEYRWFLTRAYPVKDANGNIERWIGTNTDITEQKRFSEELEKQVKERTEELQIKNLELENINAELKSFSYVASHDLKEPIRKIQVFSRRILETENFSDKTLDYFNRIISAGERMQNLIDSLLDFSRANSIELVFEPCDLNKLVEESKNDLHISIIEKQATIEYESLPEIIGVYIQISQLITNLLDNAIKYSRPEIKPLIKITSSIIEGKIIEHTSANKQKKYHAIKFEDNGIGFEQEYANKIFELFQRLHGKNEYSGTGIGLGIVKKIATNHHGFITATGTPNAGSTFTLYIPTV